MERTVDRATTVATRAEEYLKLQYGKKEGDKKTGPQKTQKQKGAVHVVTKEEATDAGQVNAVISKKKDKKKKKADGGRSTNWSGRGRGRGGRENRGRPKCYCCGDAHLLRDCPEWQKSERKIDRVLNKRSRKTPDLANPPHRGYGPGYCIRERRPCRGAARKSRNRRKIMHSEARDSKEKGTSLPQ